MKQVFLVGRYSVGKSSLFNRITGKRNLIMEEKGTTRDIIQHPFEFQGAEYNLSDSAGLEDVTMDTKLTIQQEMILQEMKRSELILLVVDGTAGIVPQDRALLDFLRKHGLLNRALLVVNKWDKKHFSGEEFFELGIEEVLFASATRGSGVYELLEVIAATLEETQPIEEKESGRVIALVGKPNAGKSTLMNALSGKTRSLVSGEEFTTRDPVREMIQKDGQAFTLVDTAGIRSRWMREFGTIYLSMRRTTKEIKHSELVLFLIDASQAIAREDQKIARMLMEGQKACVVAVNKKDLLIDREGFSKLLQVRLRFLETYPIVYISALNKQGFTEMFETLEKVYEAHHRKVTTPTINRVIQKIMMEHPLPMGGLKIFYSTQVGTAPPAFVFFVNNKRYFTDSIMNYFKRNLTRELSLLGTTVQIRIRNRRESA